MKYKINSLLFLLSSIMLFLPSSAYSLDFSLFGDVVYKSISGTDEDEKTFELGQFDLVADQEIGKSTFVTAEVVFEDPGHGFEVDVERFSVSRHVYEMLTVGLGRFHTQLGIWNHNFHHGSLIQETITRPFFLEFEDAHGGIFPNHLVGIQINGDAGSWAYSAGFGNSNGINTVESASHPDEIALEVVNTDDPSDEKSYVLRLALKPETAWLSEIGFSYMTNNVTELGKPDGPVSPFVEYGEILFDQQILGMDLRYSGEKLSLLFEMFMMSIEDSQDINPANLPSVQSESYDSTAYYLQMSYKLSNKLTGVLRFESLDFDDGSAYFDLLNLVPEDRSLIAVNYKLQESNALRFEFSTSSPDSEDSYNTIALQWFFLLI